MKTLFFSLALCCLSLAGMAQVSTETRTVGEFTGIKASSVVEIEITQGESCALVIETDAAAMKDVVTEVKDGQLSIQVENMKNVSNGIVAKVTVKNLRKLMLDGTSIAKSTNALNIDSLRIDNGGASKAELEILGGSVSTRLSGAAALKLKGSANSLTADISGAANLKAYGLKTNEVDVDASGASSAEVTANTKLKAHSSGASEILYQGKAENKEVNASGASSVSMHNASDTTNVRVGDYEVSVYEHDDEDDERSKREKKADDDDFEFWQGVDIGVNGLLTYDNKATLPPGLEFLELNYAKSYVFSLNPYQKNIHIYKNYVNLGTGIGLSWYHYNFRGSYSLQPNVPFATAINDSLNYSRNRLNMCYVNIPLMLEFNTNNTDASHSFHIGGGMEFGYNIFQNRLKQKFELDGQTHKRKVKDDFNVNPFRCDIIGRIGYGPFTIYGTYSLTTLFEKNKGPVVYPFSAGIHLDF